MDQLEAIERRRRNLRIVLFVIILATLPFYCAGILLWGSAPPRTRPITATTPAALPTRTLATATRIQLPSITPLGTLANTPGQFFTFAPATRFITATFPPPTATDFVFPTSTIAPTLTSPPTEAPPPTVEPTPIPIDTAIPLPSDTPIPDSDGDGVADNLDACPLTPAPPPSGCPPTTEPGVGEQPPSETIIPPGS
jgi:hypothetical protein